MNEFELIARYFTRPLPAGSLVAAGIGDDCALLQAGERFWAVTTDMLIEGRHFFPATDAAALGHKSLAVNLSDLAAAGAAPRCFFLALALPRVDEAWLAAFSGGLFALADRHDCPLAGGDTTRAAAGAGAGAGPITITITALGDVPRAHVRTRGGARPGDEVWVSGTLGDAALALQFTTDPSAASGGGAAGEVRLDPAQAAFCRERLDRPTPRVELGIALRGIASAAIDISDGLLGDLGHVLERSGVGASVEWEQLPRSPALRAQRVEVQRRCALAGGDDYELLFTAPASRRSAVQEAADQSGVGVTCIGRIEAAAGLRVHDAAGVELALPFGGFDHFAGGET